MCKLYLNQNLVIIHPSEFKKMEDVADYAINAIKGVKKDFTGAARKQLKPSDEPLSIKRQKVDDDGKIDTVTEDEKILNAI